MNSPKPRILCADDNEDTTSLLTCMLGCFGYEVMAAHSVAETIKLASSERFDLYLIDHHFPDGTGIDLCQMIRRFDLHIPILFFAGTAQEYEREEAINAGAQGYLIKPNDLDKLGETVMRLISKANAISA